MSAARPGLRPAALMLAFAALAPLPLPLSGAGAATSRAIRLEIRSLVNAERAERGLARLQPQGALARAARRHAQEIVRRQHVSHYSRAGEGPAGRAAGAGYTRGSRSLVVGENIGWTEQVRDPAWIVSAWLTSPSHRSILLSSRFVELGIGVERSSPDGDGRGLTVVVDFGRRTFSGGASVPPTAGPPQRPRTVAVFERSSPRPRQQAGARAESSRL